jgi:selenocysteine lyase/cysteine desulfurase
VSDSPRAATSRRAFLALTPFVAAAGAERVRAAVRALGPAPPPAFELASDEDFWREVQSSFDVDRGLCNLNNGGVSPSPRVVMESLRTHLEFSNRAPVYTMWRVLEPQIESIRQRLARAFGCDPEEVAITRNASESLETLIFGLDLARGDEIVAGEQDYPRMLHAWRQREARDGVALKLVSYPSPAPPDEEIVRLYAEAIGPRTKALHVSQITFTTGEILPVRAICALGRERGIPVIVDGAHAFAHFPFTRDDLDCDYYGATLHKWLMAPIGTGLLYVKRERIPSVWPLLASAEPRSGDVRKFEEIGTHPAANHQAIAEALAFHEGLGAERKAARLRFLRDRWVSRAKDLEGVTIRTSLEPGRSCAITSASFDGLDSEKLVAHLFEKHRIIVTNIGVGSAWKGIRVTPSVYTTLGELDYFSDALESAVRNGLPG